MKRITEMAIFLILLVLGLPFYTANVFAVAENDVSFKVKNSEGAVYQRWGRVSAIVKHSSVKTALLVNGDTTPPEINVSFLEFINDDKVYVNGTVEPEAKVKFYVNDYFREDLDEVETENGLIGFTLTGFKIGENTVKVVVEDLAENSNTIEYTVIYDVVPPEYEISEIPSILTEQPLVINGSVKESVTVTIKHYLKGSIDTEAPAKVTGLKVTDKGTNWIKIEWDENEEEDLFKYSIYRDGERLTSISDTRIHDPETRIKSNKEYVYRVSAFDEACNEGRLSDELRVTTKPFGNEATNDTFEEEESPCNKTENTGDVQETSSLFESSLTLESGVNIVIVEITDLAGNSVLIEEEVVYDDEKPVITTNNLIKLSPSYTSEVMIKGTVSENATVVVFVNNESSFSQEWMEWFTNIGPDLISKIGKVSGGETSYVARTDSNGEFSIPVTLRRENVVTVDDSGSSSSTGKAWLNHIKIVATDDVGLVSEPEEGVVNYTLCGFGSDWKIDLSDTFPDKITPRYVIEGLAQLSFTADFKWQGVSGSSSRITSARLEPMLMNVEEQEVFDEEWISISDQYSSPDGKSAYFLIDVKSPETIPGETLLEKEQWISEHNAGECKADVADIIGFGCLKYPLMLEIEYDYTDPYTHNTTKGKVQKQCWTGEIIIDARVPPSKFLPESFLKGSIETIDSIIEIIDTVLEPLNVVKQVLFVGCLVSWGTYFVKKGLDFFQCVSVNYKTCDPDKDDEDCKSCLTARQDTLNLFGLTQWMCDRVACPAVPTVHKYIKDAPEASHCKGQDLNKIEYDRKLNDDVDQEYKDADNYNIEVRPGATGYGTKNKYCEAEYMREWDSGAVLMNELEESKCLTQAGKENDSCQGIGAIPRLLSGVCSGEGGIPKRTVISEKVDGKQKYYIIGKDSDNEDWKAVWNGTKREEFECDETSAEFGDCKADKTYDVFVSRNEKIFSAKEDCYNGTDEDAVLRSYNESLFKSIVPKSVYNLVCTESRELAIDPTADLISAFRAVCVTAISGYLSFYRTVLQVVKNCFETILLTGDGSAGVCQELLSVYVCDLIYFAIRCIAKRASVEVTDMSGGVRGDIAGFISYITNAGSETEDKIKGRYGGTNMFKTLFDERKLVHSLCVFAFTGDFEIGTLIETSTSVDIPVASFCTLDVKRRFMKYNPLDGGMATHLYHTGVMIVSGAEDLEYNVVFQCSKDNQCNPDEFDKGECDCLFYDGGNEQTRSILSGSLAQGEVLNEEILDNSVLLTTPFRYDRAYVDITYTNNQGERVDERCVNPDIMMEGGRAPAHCKFDLGNMEYRCAYSFGEKGWMEFVGEPTIEPELHLGEPIIVKGKINKQSASSEKEVMYARVKIYDGDENSIYLYDSGYKMITKVQEGEIDLESLNLVEIMVTDELFGSLGESTPSYEKVSGLIATVSGHLRTEVMVSFTANGDNYAYAITVGEGGNLRSGESNSGTFSESLTFTVDSYGETASIKIDGTPSLDDGVSSGDVRIIPGIDGSGDSVKHKDLILEISLHHEMDNTPISYGGEEQVRKLNFEILSSKKD